MKNFKTIPSFLALIFGTSVFAQEAHPEIPNQTVLESFAEVRLAVDSSIHNTISTSDSLTLIIEEIAISEAYMDKPRIIEVVCELVTNEGKQQSFKTVHKAVLHRDEFHKRIDSNFNIVISSQPLANVRKVNINFELRPIEEENVELFKKISGLLSAAAPDSGAIDILREVLPSPETSEENPTFVASYRIPNNFYHFNNIKKSNTPIPMFEPGKPEYIAFSKSEKILSQSLIGNIVNAVAGGKYITDNSEISGYIKITPTKLDARQVNNEIQNKMYEAYNLLLSTDINKSEKAKILLQEAETMNEIYYPNYSSIERGNIEIVIELIRLYSRYETSRDYEIAPDFSTWVARATEASATHGMNSVLVNDFYQKDKSARVFLPIPMNNQMVSATLYMQKMLHKSMRRLTGDKNNMHYIDRVSTSSKDTQLASNN